MIDAYRRLCEPGADLASRRPAPPASPGGDLTDGYRQTPTQRLEGPNPRLVRIAMASALVFGASVCVVFFLVAFSQSGR